MADKYFVKKILLVLVILSFNAWARPVHESESILLLNATTDRIEFQHNADKVRSIASITKLMTAMIAIDADQDWQKSLKLSRRTSSHLPQQEYTRGQLLEAMLIKSDNAAAETLAENYPGGRSAFVQRMNFYAHNWGLENTKFVDPSGLSPFNISTAKEVADIVNTATNYWFIRDVGAKKHLEVKSQNKKKNTKIKLEHTSGDILTLGNVLVSKTGLTTSAGWCVGLSVERARQQYVIVVLGAKNKLHRLSTIKEIMHNHVLDN